MKSDLKEILESIRMSFAFFGPELSLITGILLLITAGLIFKERDKLLHGLTLTIFLVTALFSYRLAIPELTSQELFAGAVKSDSFNAFLRILFDVAGVFTVLMTLRHPSKQARLSEYYALITAVVLGAHLLIMSESLLMVFISLELISISSYVLTAFAFDKKSAEGSLKYFIFGSVASAVMLYGFSILYGITGTLNFTSIEFIQSLADYTSPILIIAGTFSLAGFLFKLAAAPMHPWAPDVYESAPIAVVAFFAVVPKLAGIGVLFKFLLSLNLFGQSFFDWQLLAAGIAILTLTVGNFSALAQKNVKRLMAYSSIAQSGFLLVAVISFSPQGLQFLLFYATVYLVLNFLVFLFLQYYENLGFTTIADFTGVAKQTMYPSVFLLIGLIGLTGLPPTAGFTAKLFIFSSLWESYAASNKPLLLWLLIFGLLNTVVSLFYYLRIPFFAFIRPSTSVLVTKNSTLLNLLGLVLVLVVLILFFSPGLLMGWINKINFAF